MRITRPIAAALLLALAPVATTGPVLAQATSEDPTMAMARARFKEGVEFYDKGEYEQARGSFLQAYALKKHPAVLLNLAWSCLKSGHPIDAERYFKQFLTEGRDITDKQRADANDGLNQAHIKLGRIEVVAAPGTEVTIDGEKVGSAPVGEPVSVEAGAHTVKFKGVDGSTDTQSITVMGGEKALARFKTTPAAAPPAQAAPPPAAAAAPPPPAEEATAPPSAAPPASEEPTRRAERSPASRTAAPPDAEKKGAFSTPKNVAPVIILGLGAVAGYGVAIAMSIFKQSALEKANALADQINHAGGGCDAHPDGCSAYSTDIGNVNDDATWGNVALVVGVAATAGAVAYWLLSDKEDSKESGRPLVTPLLGPNLAGASLGGRF